MYFWAEPFYFHISLVNLFIFRWEKKSHPESRREKDKETRKIATHPQAESHSPGVNMRKSEWHATEKCGLHTGVSKHSAPGPTAEWCLRDKAEAYKPCHAPQGPLLLCRLSLSHISSLFVHHRVNKQRWTRREIQGVTSPSARLCFSLCSVLVDMQICSAAWRPQQQQQQQQKADMSHLTVMCSLANMVTDVQMRRSTFLPDCWWWYNATHFVQ